MRGRRQALLMLVVIAVAGCSSGAVGSADPSPSMDGVEPSPTGAGSPAIEPTPTDEPTTAPTEDPTTAPTDAPTPVATEEPTPEPTATPNPAFAGCPSGQEDTVAGLVALDLRMLVEGQELGSSGTTSVSARNGTYEGSDQIPGYAFLDLEQAPVIVDAGGRIDVRVPRARMTRLDPARRLRFDGFTFDGLPQYDGPPPVHLDSGVEDGRGWIRAPRRAGTWVIEFYPAWQTRCFAGSGINWVVVRTR